MVIRYKHAIILVLIVSIMFSGMLKAENNSIQIKESTIEPLSSTDLGLGKLTLGISFDEVEKIMKPVKLLESKKNEDIGFMSLEYNDGTEIVISYQAVQYISVKSKKYPTPRGLVIGDKKEKVLKLYGEPNQKYEDTLWEYNVGDDDFANLSILFKGNSVIRLEVLVREI